jgi:hypothetical protein
MHGKGVITWGKDTTYKGNFIMGQMDGIGIQRSNPEIPWSEMHRWREGQWYFGEVSAGKFNGRGQFHWYIFYIIRKGKWRILHRGVC